VKTQGHITNRSLSLLGQSAFVHAAVAGSPCANPQASTMNERHADLYQRPVASLRHEDWMHPGNGGGA